MKIQVTASELGKKLQRALAVIPAKVTIPALEYAKIEIKDATSATISGSDLGMSVIQNLSIQLLSTELGTMMVPAKRLRDSIAPLPSDAVVTLELTAEGLHIKSGKLLKQKLPVLPPAVYPAIEARVPTQFNFNAAAFKKVITRVEIAAPAKAGKTSVASVKIESTATNLRAVATDGFRIAVADAPGAGSGDISLQVPKNFISILKEIPGDVIQYSESETNLFFATETETLLVRRPATNFPNYSKIVSFNEFITTFDVAVPSLKTALQIAQATADDKVPSVYLEAANGELTISTPVNAYGQTESGFEVKMDGPANKSKINLGFVIDFLSQSEGSVKVQMVSPQMLVKFSNDNLAYYVMPVQDAPKEEAKDAAKA